MSKPLKHYDAVEKVAILRRHLIERIPVSDFCDQGVSFRTTLVLKAVATLALTTRGLPPSNACPDHAGQP